MALSDAVVVGAGVVGLATAYALARRGRSVVVVDKEPTLGAHASGRNSGVLHAGFYYSDESLKAELSARGNRRWRVLCDDDGVPVNPCGKLVVARSAAEVPVVQALVERGQRLGVDVRWVSREEARVLEPRVRTCQGALWSPTTATLNPRSALRALGRRAQAAGVSLRLGQAVLGRTRDGVRLLHGEARARVVVNAAGLFADRLADLDGVRGSYRIAPFRGLYLHASPSAPPLRRAIYPVPEPGMPFLGVHFTPTVSGGHHIGPTALPAAWREQYGGLRGLRRGEAPGVLWRHAALILGQAGFRALARREAGKLSRRYLVERARPLLSGVSWRDYRRWGAPGIRAQLLDTATGKLVDDFVLRGTARSVHVLNAVSPAFTCALPFGERVAAEVEARL